MKALNNGFLRVDRIWILSMKPKYWVSEFDNRQLMFGMVYSIWLCDASLSCLFVCLFLGIVVA